MSVFQKIFGSQPSQQPAPAAQPTPTLPGNIPATNTNPALAGNPTVPAASMNEPAKEVSPLDGFSKLWETDPNAKAAQNVPMFNMDPVKMAEAAKKNDFSSVVTPELMARITAGGEGAMQASLEAMNLMNQKAFADSALVTTQIVEQALNAQTKKYQEMLPNLIKQQNVSDNLRSSNPVFNHPAAQPVLDMFKKQIMTKNPNASAKELEDMANNYLLSLTQAATPPKATQSGIPGKDDWSDFFPE